MAPVTRLPGEKGNDVMRRGVEEGMKAFPRARDFIGERGRLADTGRRCTRDRGILPPPCDPFALERVELWEDESTYSIFNCFQQLGVVDGGCLGGA